jgi:hypothetical protein
MNLYRGQFLEGNYEDWAVARREHYAMFYESILSKLVRECGDAGAGRLLLARNPYDERAYAAVIAGELDARRPAATRDLFTLADELGTIFAKAMGRRTRGQIVATAT